MKILFLTSTVEDYLADAVLHGLRMLYGADCVDYPKCEILYKECPEQISSQVRGNGFTLYSGLLDEINVDRFHINYKVEEGKYDLIVIGDIFRQFSWLTQYRPWLNAKNCIVLDSADTTQPYPAAGFWWRRPYYWFLPRAHPYFLYFKREWIPDTHFSIIRRLLPQIIRTKLPPASNLRRIAFGIPAEKIVDHLPEKKKNFPTHIVDPEVAALVAGSHTSYAFSSEKEYYSDLQESRFGITTKRAGWDCLRHYEIACNGTVMCFRDLDLKPDTCAPHGLSSENCIIYKNADDLMRKIESISDAEYARLQAATLRWINDNTTVMLAKRIIEEVKKVRT